MIDEEKVYETMSEVYGIDVRPHVDVVLMKDGTPLATSKTILGAALLTYWKELTRDATKEEKEEWKRTAPNAGILSGFKNLSFKN